jgi:hypothetical protein
MQSRADSNQAVKGSKAMYLARLMALLAFL